MEDKANIRIGKLTSVGRVGIEIGRIYRKVRRGEIRSEEGNRMVQMLMGLKSCLETSDIEKQIAELQAQIASVSNVVPFRKNTA